MYIRAPIGRHNNSVNSTLNRLTDTRGWHNVAGSHVFVMVEWGRAAQVRPARSQISADQRADIRRN